MPKTDTKDTIKIHDLGWEGEGVGRMSDGQVVFVDGALPGDKIIPRFAKKTGKGPLKAEIREITQPSPDRIEHPCPFYAESCPASPLGALKYTAALEWKRNHLTETLRRIGNITDAEVAEAVPSELQWGYRDRIELQFKPVKEKKTYTTKTFTLPPGSVKRQDPLKVRFGYLSKYDFIPVSDCLLPSEPVRKAISSLVLAVSEDRLDLNLVSNSTRVEKNPRMLIRDNGHGGAVAVLFAPESYIIPNDLAASILLETNLTGIQVRMTPNLDLRYFVSDLLDEAGETRVFFPLSNAQEVYAGPTIFTQANMRMSSVLRQIVLENLPPKGNVLDMYGGIGAFALEYALIKGGNATVIDSSRDSLKAGRKFAMKNKLPVEFLDVNLSRSNFRLDSKKFDALIVDPPHKGIDKNILQKINDEGPGIIAYVSCHPAALARDVKSLTGYTPVKIIPVDMFPQTTELETVCILHRK